MANTQAAQHPPRLLARVLEAQRRDGPLIAWAIAVGALAGVVGGIFRAGVDHARSAFASLGAFSQQLPLPDWLLPALAGAGVVTLSVWCVRRFAPEAGGSGVQEIEGALDGVRTLRWRRVIPVKFGAGLLALGSGLALGREGPTIQLGGALGQALCERFRLDPEKVHVLVAAGSGAGLAAAFSAPLAGMLFVIEEMRPQFHYNVISVQAVLVACAVADVMVRLILGDAVALPIAIFDAPGNAVLWSFPIFGALIGLLGYAFNTALLGGVDTAARLGERGRLLFAAGMGAAIGVLGVQLPELTGGGDRLIADMLDANLPALALLAILTARFAVTIASYSTGAPGGIFSPMLALGTCFGLCFGHFAHALAPSLVTHPHVFSVAAMGALFAATVRAPVTGIVLAVELTDNYAQLLPLILTCVPATLVAHGLGGTPIYTALLERMLARDSHSDPEPPPSSGGPGAGGGTLAPTRSALTFYTKSDCPLCDHGRAVVEALAQQFPLTVDYVNIESDPALQARFGERVPVLMQGERELGWGRLSEKALSRALETAEPGEDA